MEIIFIYILYLKTNFIIKKINWNKIEKLQKSSFSNVIIKNILKHFKTSTIFSSDTKS